MSVSATAMIGSTLHLAVRATRTAMNTAATAPRKPATEPTDRSMWPMTMISSIPRAITRMYPFWRKTFVTFSDLSMTPLVVTWKNRTAKSRTTNIAAAAHGLPDRLPPLVLAASSLAGVPAGIVLRGCGHSTTSSAPARASRMMAFMIVSWVASAAGISAAIRPAAMT